MGSTLGFVCLQAGPGKHDTVDSCRAPLLQETRNFVDLVTGCADVIKNHYSFTSEAVWVHWSECFSMLFGNLSVPLGYLLISLLISKAIICCCSGSIILFDNSRIIRWVKVPPVS